MRNKAGVKLDCIFEETLDYIDIDYTHLNKTVRYEERPHGEWIFHKYDKDFECSNCHVRFDRTQIYTEKRFENALWAKMEIYNFCPNCGASMVKKEGEQNGENE